MVRLKPGYKLRERDQLPTLGVSIAWIMTQPTFALGAADARAGRPYRADYDLWETNAAWNYERGRQWAALAPRDLPLKVNGKLNPAALAYGDAIL